MPNAELTELQKEQLENVYLPKVDQAAPELFVSQYLSTAEGKFEAAQNRRRILWGVNDAGGTDYALPVLRKLQQEAIDVFVLASGPGKDAVAKNLDNLGLKVSGRSTPHRRLEELEPSLIIAGHSAQPAMEQAVFGFAKQNGIFSVGTEDMPPFWGFYKRDAAREGKLILPDELLVFTNSSGQQEVEYIPELQGKTTVVGSPAFDKIAQEDLESDYNKVREELGIEEFERYIVYMATKSESTLASFRDLVAGIKKMQLPNFRLTARIHPAEQKDPTIKAQYDQILSSLGQKVIDTNTYPTNDIAKAADVVVTDTSTEGLVAVLRGKDTIHMLIRENMLLRDEWKDELPPTPGVVLDRSSAVIKYRDKVADVLFNVLYDESFKRDMSSQRAKWQVDGKAAQRVVSKLMEYIDR